jgi:uncharacterized protein YbjT (DUF2867 family)
MSSPHHRDSIVVVGANGRTGICVLRYLCATSIPVIACVRRPDRLPAEPRLASAEVAIVNLEQPGTLLPWIERAVHVIYVAGSSRKSLSPGAWQVEVESLTACVEFAERSGFEGRFIYVGHTSGDERGVTWSESRWRELKREAEGVITASSLNYFILRTGHVADPAYQEPRVGVSQSPFGGEATLPCNVLAFLLTGAAIAGAVHRTKVNVRVDQSGARLQEAVQAFGRLRTDRVETAAENTRGGMAYHRR